MLFVLPGFCGVNLKASGEHSLPASKHEGSELQGSQRAQYPLIKEYALNYKGPYIMI